MFDRVLNMPLDIISSFLVALVSAFEQVKTSGFGKFLRGIKAN